MSKYRLLLAAAVLVLSSAAGYARDHDIEQLQARLAAQEARMADQDAKMNDLQAKLNQTYGSKTGESPENIISLRKNATVTIGGLVTTKYTYTQAKEKSVYDHRDPADPVYNDGEYRKRMDHKHGSLEVGDAEVHVQIDVNDHFEAFILMNLHRDIDEDGQIAEEYWMRWKDICNSGFGLLVGRAPLVFGAEGVGELGSYAAGTGDGLGELSVWRGSDFDGGFDRISDSYVPHHNGWDVSGVTQITPYWEGFDGKLLFELSFMNHVYEDTPGFSSYGYMKRGVYKDRSRNYGFGTMAARIGVEPIENLKFTLSFANYRDNSADNRFVDMLIDGDRAGYGANGSKNNTVFGLAASWRPCFFDRLNLWGQWIHGNDVYFMDDVKSDAINFGLSFDIMENLTWFAQGDYLRTRYGDFFANDMKATAWSFYTGLQYSLAYGVSLEAGWKHERIKYKDNTGTLAKIRGNTIYGMVGFEF